MSDSPLLRSCYTKATYTEKQEKLKVNTGKWNECLSGLWWLKFRGYSVTVNKPSSRQAAHTKPSGNNKAPEMCSRDIITARREKCCDASVILWWHGDIVEAAGRLSRNQMNYSIRVIALQATSPVPPGSDWGCCWTPCRTQDTHGAENSPCWLPPPQQQALTGCYCPWGDQDRAPHLWHRTETNACPVLCRTKVPFLKGSQNPR